MHAVLANFDGIVGPTHNYAGLSYGNVASGRSGGATSHPRAAALQGLAKMKFLADLGIPQGVLPPHDRPHVPSLRRLGYTGTDAQVVARAAADDATLFASFCSASAMWTANAATVSAAAGTADRRTHLTPANLVAKLHRSIEPPTTAAILRATFADPDRFTVHDPLPASDVLGDEGAANHTSLATAYSEPPLEIFVYGRVAADASLPHPARFPARQTLEASRAVARLHGLDPARCVFVQQSPAAIDAGVFHNDVIAVGDLDTLLYHELAYVDAEPMLARCRAHLGEAFRPVRVPADRVSLHDAVRSYLFNSQLVRVDGELHLVAPTECRDTPTVAAYVQELVEAGILDQVHFLDVRESMRNGGGPACLRLRVPLGEGGLAGINPGSLLDDALHARLVAWVERHYRDDVTPADLADPSLLDESRSALDELTTLLGLGTIYEFQRV